MNGSPDPDISAFRRSRLPREERDRYLIVRVQGMTPSYLFGRSLVEGSSEVRRFPWKTGSGQAAKAAQAVRQEKTRAGPH